MPTFYKPTKMRGKRVIYQSTDPAEPKRETIKAIVWVGILLFAMGILLLVERSSP